MMPLASTNSDFTAHWAGMMVAKVLTWAGLVFQVALDRDDRVVGAGRGGGLSVMFKV